MRIVLDTNILISEIGFGRNQIFESLIIFSV
jgi:predicted nucleic acid-binding protein